MGSSVEMKGRAEQARGYRREAEKYAKLAKSGQLDITNVHRTMRSVTPGWRKIWSDEKI
jgi:hypothetical protein